MQASSRQLWQAAGGLLAVAGGVLWIVLTGPGAVVGATLAGIGAAIVVVATVRRSVDGSHESESDDITALGEARRRELIRGTSLFLREMEYRYSVRIDTSGTGDRRCFAAEVNTIRLGFIPAIVTDTTTDRQGFGYVAFVHDGHRWRGPGLPCPADQAQAVRHAARCVSPLATDEETKYEGSD